MSQESKDNPVHLLWVGILIEGGMAALALTIGLSGFFAANQDIRNIDGAFCKEALVWGAIGTVPLLIYLSLFHFWTPSPMKPMKRFVETHLQPMFRASTLLELIILSLMAGIAEELLFRWCIQGGIDSWLQPQLGGSAALFIALISSSLIFGICHWVNPSYGISTMIIGLYLGILMAHFENWLVPAVTHALFDFVALYYIARVLPSPNSLSE